MAYPSTSMFTPPASTAENVARRALFALPPIFVGGSIDLNVDVMTDGDIVTVGLDVDGTGLADVVSTGAGAGVEDEAAAGVASLHGIIVFELDRGRTSFEHVVFEGAGMTVRGAARYTAATLGGIESLDVTVAATEMARLGLLIPPLRTTVPGALRLSGAGSGSLRASPTEVTIELALDGANVRLGEALQKNAGDRLQVSLRGNRDSDAAHDREGANRASGRVDATVNVVLPHGVHIMGDVMFQPGGPDIALFDLHTNRPTLAHAATLSPVLRDLVAGAVEKGSLRVGLLGTMSDVGSRFDFTLRGHDVRIVVNDGKTIAAGDTTMALVAVTDSSGLRLDVFARLDGLVLSSADGDGLLFEKKTGVPLTVRGHLVEAHGRGALGRALSSVDAKDEEAGVVFVASGLSARWRRIALGLNGAVSVRGDHARLFGVDIDDIVVDLALRQGRMVFRRGDFTLPTGPVSIATSAVNIGTVVPQWELRVVAVDVDLAQVLQPLQAITGAVSGTVTVDAQLKGVGLSLESLVESVQGPVRFAAHDVEIAALTEISNWLDEVWDMIAMLPGVSAREVEISRGTLSKTAIRNGVWVAHIHDDALWLDKPISVTTTLGELTFAAHAGLDGRIDLRMALKIDDDDDHTLEAAVTGTWSDPVITTTNLDAAGPWRKGADTVQKQVNDFTDALTRWFGTGSVEP